MNVDDLNLVEQKLLSRVESVTGLMEEKHEQLLQNGVYDDYAKICVAYLELFNSESQKLESLKRAIFLSWHSVAEPCCFSGLFSLSQEVTRTICDELEQTIVNKKMDFELNWMLPYYNQVSDFPFSQHSHLRHTKSFLAKSDFSLWQKTNLDAKMFVNRGQMGIYWLSVVR